MLRQRDKLAAADVVIVVAGMDGALPSVVGGLVDCPVIACPTSVGYGASFGGVAALLTMLNSCSAGVCVVNIDAGFKAGYAAAAHRSSRSKSKGPRLIVAGLLVAISVHDSRSLLVRGDRARRGGVHGATRGARCGRRRRGLGHRATERQRHRTIRSVPRRHAIPAAGETGRYVEIRSGSTDGTNALPPEPVPAPKFVFPPTGERCRMGRGRRRRPDAAHRLACPCRAVRFRTLPLPG